MTKIKKNAIVAHREHKTIGVVLNDFSHENIDRGEVRTDADGMVHKKDLVAISPEVYNLIGPITGYHVAPSTQELIESLYPKTKV